MCILAILILSCYILALHSLLRSDADTVSKALWASLIIGMPFSGLVIWYLLGPKKSQENDVEGMVTGDA